MRKKIITVFLSLFLTFSSSIKVNANPLTPILAPEILGVVATVATASGVVFKSVEDVYNLCRIFVDDNINNLAYVVKTFSNSVYISATNKVVTVEKDFLNICKSTFDKMFAKSNPNIINNAVFSNYSKYGFPYRVNTSLSLATSGTHDLGNGLLVDVKFDQNFFMWGADISYKNQSILSYNSSDFSEISFDGWEVKPGAKVGECKFTAYGDPTTVEFDVPKVFGGGVSFPYNGSSYDWNKINSNLGSNGSVNLYVPSNVGNLQGVSSNSVIASNTSTSKPPYQLPTNGIIEVPKVSDPSISLGQNISIPTNKPIDKPIDKPTDKPIDKPIDKPTDKPNDTTDKPTDPNDPPNDNGQCPSFPPMDLFPPWGKGIDFTPVTNNLKFGEKFPFCLASDVKGILGIFDVSPKAPKFDVPIFTEKIRIDLTKFNVWANIIRLFILIGFVICLINITRRVIG